MNSVLLARAKAAEADALVEIERLRTEANNEATILAEVVGQRDGCRAEVARLRGIVGAARLLILLAKPAYNAPLSWDEDRIAWLDYSGQDAS